MEEKKEKTVQQVAIDYLIDLLESEEKQSPEMVAAIARLYQVVINY